MDDKFSTEDETSQSKKRNISSKLRALLTIIVTVLLAVAALLCFLYRDYLSSDGLRRLLGREISLEDESEPFTYENGSSLCFAAAGDGFAVASTSGIQLLDSAGRTVVKEICSMGTPAVSACKSAALFFDIGGSGCTLAKFDGSCLELDVGESVISASMNSSGYFVVISETSGSKGLVQVFDSVGQLLYQWYSGSGYALKAQLSPDNKRLAVLCAETSGSFIHILRLNSETELTKYSYPGQLLFDLNFMTSGEICAISDSALYFQDIDSDESAVYSFDNKYLGCYDLSGSGFVAVYLSDYTAGTAGSLISVDSSGSALGSAAISGNLISISANGKQLLACSSGNISLYSNTMELQKSEDTLITAKQALLRQKGDVLLLSSYSAELFDF